MYNRKQTGSLGEKAAARYLGEIGFGIIAKNWCAGRVEIDIIAADSRLVLFVEVKTRTGYAYGSPEESISPGKVRNIRKAAAAYLMENGRGKKRSARFDVISIKIDRKKLLPYLDQEKDMEVIAGHYKMFARLVHIRDAF